MNSKQLSNVLIVACLIAMLAWWRWHSATPPPKKAPTVQTRPQPLQRADSPDAPVPDYNPPPEPNLANIDPALLQAALELVARQQMEAQDAFTKVRANAQDKAVTSNLRQLAAASDQYFDETGRSSVASFDLVGTNSSQYLKPFPTVAGETYTEVILQGQPVSASGVSGARTITYGP
jgi:hypothetical protein